MAATFLDALESGRILVADGGIGTGLQELGLKAGQPPEELIIDAPDAVLELHRRFVAAGAEVILTNTFGGTPVRLRDSAYPDRAAELNRRGAELAREATWVVLCGSPPEQDVLEDIRLAAGGNPRVHNCANELPIPRLLALIEQAHSMVSVDTGPAHAAAALGCPLVVMFGAASPEKWRPIGPGEIVVLGGDRGAASRVSDIAVETVIAAWRKLPTRA